MGNVCGKADSGAFDPPGRVLGTGTAPPIPGQARTAAVPAQAQRRGVGGPPRTLGGATTPGPSSADAADARRKAAEAAQARNAPKPQGRLGSNLEAQRRENRIDTLKKASEAEVRQREMDAAAHAAAHN